MNEQEITLDLSKEPAVAPIVYLGQGDANGTTIIANIYDNGLPFSFSSNNKSAKLIIRLPDGETYYETTGTTDGNVATFAIDETYAASVAGVTDVAYVEAYQNTTYVASTNRFRVVILESAEEGADPATAYHSGIQEAIDRANAAAEAAEGVVLQDVPLMSANIRGGAQLGDGLKIEDGKLSLDGAATVPIATTTTPGIVKPDGTTITVAQDGTISGADTVPIATTSVAGKVKPDGTTITVSQDGTISGASTYELPTMGVNTKGGAKVGNGLTVSNDTLSANVTGIKGNAEDSYRTGNVNLTPANLGAATQTDLDTAEQDISDLQDAVGDVDVSTDGSLQEQVTALGESVSKFNVSSWISQVEFAAGNTKTLTLSQGSGGPEARLMFGSSGIRVEYRPTPNDTWQAKNSFF